jgi:multiple sugar transport system permease protein
MALVQRSAVAPVRAARRFSLTRRERRNLILGLLFISPWLFGFVALMIYPIIYSFGLSFTRYSGFGDPQPIGISNYTRMLSDPLFLKSAFNTLYYTALAVPIGVVVAIVLALAMNSRVREVSIYRAALYLPSVLPVFALTFIFIVLLNPRFGLFNHGLRAIGLEGPDWLGNPAWTKLGLVLLAQLGAGQVALIFLAGLRAIPRDLYESAEIDGAGAWRRFKNITLPMLTPLILYDLILGLSLGLQVFTQAYVMTSGGARAAGPDNSLLFYVFYLYKQAFQFGAMGYAEAMAVVLFVVSMVIALAVFRWAKRWVYYEAEQG